MSIDRDLRNVGGTQRRSKQEQKSVTNIIKSETLAEGRRASNGCQQADACVAWAWLAALPLTVWRGQTDSVESRSRLNGIRPIYHPTQASINATADTPTMSSMMEGRGVSSGGSSSPSPLCIGVLALQGAFQEHAKILQELGVQTREVRIGSTVRLVGCWGLTGDGVGMSCMYDSPTHGTGLL